MPLEDDWAIGTSLEYDYFWGGIQKSHLSDNASGIDDVENDQKHGFGVRGSIKLQRKSEKLDFIVEPFIKYWNIEKSEETSITASGSIIGYGYEPKNNSTEFGCKLAVKF
jgi:hypothetical protein